MLEAETADYGAITAFVELSSAFSAVAGSVFGVFWA